MTKTITKEQNSLATSPSGLNRFIENQKVSQEEAHVKDPLKNATSSIIQPVTKNEFGSKSDSLSLLTDALTKNSMINSDLQGVLKKSNKTLSNESTSLMFQAPKNIQKDMYPQPVELNNWWKNFQKLFKDNNLRKFQFFRNYFTLSLNSFGIFFNFLAVITGNSNLVSKNLSEKIDKGAEWFSKYLIPLSFGWNGVEAAVGNRGLEAFARIIPAISFLFLPFHNFNIATGVSSGLQYLFELVRDRHGGKHPATHDIIENAKETLRTSFVILKDIFTFNRTHEDFKKQISTLSMLFGGFGGLIFSSQERDSLSARFFGNLRNIGGLIADWKLIFNDVKNNLRRAFDLRLVGALCSTASIINILMRWVNPQLARTLNHISIAIDDFGLTYWAQCSKKDNDEQFNSKKTLET